MKPFGVALAAIAVTTAITAAAPADSDLSAAKNLYASAAYEDALAMLTRLATGSPAKDVGLQIDEYRSLCLYALGRSEEAETVFRSVLEKDPLFRPADDDLSPRVQAMFTDVRRRLLPTLAKDRFRIARAAVDAREFVRAESELTDVQRIIAEARQLDPDDDTLTDLASLADGFRDLAHTSLLAAAPAIVAAPATTPAPPTVVPAGARPYTAADDAVAPPTALVQVIPPIPGELLNVLHNRRGVLEITIDTDGRVTGATMRQSLNELYDGMVISAARQWRYKPAVRDGVAVRYVKAIALEVRVP